MFNKNFTNPALSFALSLTFWIGLLAFFSYDIAEKILQPETFLELDASIVDDVTQNKNFSEKNATEELEGQKKAENKPASEASQNLNHKKIIPLFQPLPDIPPELRSEAFNSYAIARFHIAKDGSVTQVELLKSTANSRLNELLLRSLKRWKFSMNSNSDETLMQDIRVRFAVEE